jgi:hypothetical protein
MPRAEDLREPLSGRQEKQGSCCAIALVVTLLLCITLWWLLPEVQELEIWPAEEENWQCNNTLDFGGLEALGKQYHRRKPVAPTCAELIDSGKYSCDVDFCAPSADNKTTCALGPTYDENGYILRPGLCDRECNNGKLCKEWKPPGALMCMKRALGRVEMMVILVYILAWVNLMFPALLPLARCTTALVSAVLIVAIRKLGHDATWKYGDGVEVMRELADNGNPAPSGRCIYEHDLFANGITMNEVKTECWTQEGKDRYQYCTTNTDCDLPATCHPELCPSSGNEADNPGCKSARALL